MGTEAKSKEGRATEPAHKARQLANMLAVVLAVYVVRSASAVAVGGSVAAWGGGQQGLPAGLTNVTAVSTALDHSLALRSDGSVVAWGYNFDNQCAVPPGLGQVIGITAGAFFSVALNSDGTVMAWGDNQYSQTEVPIEATNIVAVSAGRGHVLALKPDTTVIAWGSDIYGQCDVPAGLSNVVAVFAAWNYSLALRADGTVAAWGVNDAGQTDLPQGLADVTALAGNMEYCLALKKDGTVVAWGKAPRLPVGLSNLKAIAAGQNHCLGLTSDGTIVVWGANDSGQIDVPPHLGDASALGAGWDYSLAVVGGGTTSTGTFNLQSATWLNGVFRVSLTPQTNRSYVLQFKKSLADPNWIDLASATGTQNVITFFDSEATNSLGFYRVREQ